MASNQEMLSAIYLDAHNLAEELLADGVKYKYGILPILVETQRRQAVNHQQTMGVLAALANDPNVTVEQITEIVNTATDRAITELKEQ